MTIVAFAGASRVGKTTLMNAVAAKLGSEYRGRKVEAYHSEVAAWLAELGFDAQEDVTLGQRIFLQRHLATRYLQVLDRMVADPDTLYLMDRSWADLAAYMLADVPRGIDSVSDGAVMNIVNMLRDRASDQSVVLVRPGIPLAPPQPGKANATHSFQMHIDLLITGLLVPIEGILRKSGLGEDCLRSENPLVLIGADTLDIDTRVEHAMFLINITLDN